MQREPMINLIVKPNRRRLPEDSPAARVGGGIIALDYWYPSSMVFHLCLVSTPLQVLPR